MKEVEIGSIEDEILFTTDEILSEIAHTLEQLLKENAPIDTGELRNSLKVLGRRGNNYIVGTRLSYAPRVEFGTDPFTPKIQPLKEWSRRNLDKESDAWKVKHKIETEGIEGDKFFRKSIEEVKRRYG